MGITIANSPRLRSPPHHLLVSTHHPDRQGQHAPQPSMAHRSKNNGKQQPAYREHSVAKLTALLGEKKAGDVEDVS